MNGNGFNGKQKTKLAFRKHETVMLKNLPDFNEQWLQTQIAEDPTILGLGDLVLIQRERRQERAGRLDLLLADLEENRRYEVELMLGTTDESHIVRTIEYWDIERRRYPGYEHIAVLVAEEVTTRFLNVLSLMAGTIPLVVIQLNAIQVDSDLLLSFVRVLDQRSLRRDDEADTKLVSVDRTYWMDRSNASILALADDLLSLINETAEPKQHLNYNRHYVGLSDGTRSRNFVYFLLRKKYLRMVVPGGWTEEWGAKLEEAGLTADNAGDKLRVTLSPQDLNQHRELIVALVAEIVQEQQRS